LSGIYKSHDYSRAHTEQLPYYPNEIKSIYHVRSYDVFKLFQVKEPIDVMLSHDWPQGIEHHGDTQQLWSCKPFLRRDSEIGELGSPPAMSLLKKMRPRYWFSGHMHVKFAAIVSHGEEELPPAQELWEQKASLTLTGSENPDELELELDESVETNPITAKNPDELELDLDDDNAPAIAASAAINNPDELDLELEEEPAATPPDELGLDVSDNKTSAPPPPPLAATPKTSAVPSSTPSPNHPTHTHFLALDKALPNRSFLQFLTVPFTHPRPPDTTTRTTLTYDPEFLSITRALNSYPAVSPSAPQDLQSISPDNLSSLIQENRKWVDENIVAKDKLEIPRNFAHTAPAYQHGERVEQCSKEWRSPQMEQFCELLGMENWVWGSEEEWERKRELMKMNPPTRYGGGGGGGGGGGWRGGRGGSSGGRGRGRGRGYGRGS
jgi:lariat debranching enzyme